MKQSVVAFSAAFLAVVLSSVAYAEAKKAGVTLGAPKASAPSVLSHELWGQTSYGDGYVYGPRNRRAGMTVVDLDGDGDNDFVFPSSINAPEWMVNLGSPEAFYPGGTKVLNVQGLPAHAEYDIGLEFGDLDGDSLPDMLAVLAVSDPFVKQVAWFKNLGPRSNPSFAFQGIVYASPQDNFWDAVFVSLADIDNDKDLDLFVMEAFTRSPDRSHRIFKCENIGTSSAPQFGSASEITELSELMPLRLSLDKANAPLADGRPAPPPLEKLSGKDKGVAYTYNVSDISLVDWDFDGDLDFLFYDRQFGLYWIENLGDIEDPVWDSELGYNIYSHQEVDNVSVSSGSFADRANPNAARPGAEWLDEIYLSINNRLKILRYFTGYGYGIVSQSAVAFEFGPGPAAFWDYDYDGDLDMFKAAPSGTRDSVLQLITNRGTAYAPAWDDTYRPINDIALDLGSSENGYREDQFVIAPYDSPGFKALYVQHQDATVDVDFAYSPESFDGLPTFEVLQSPFDAVVDPSHENILATGIAVADFDGDGLAEIITSYAHSENGDSAGSLTVVDLSYDGGDGDLSYVTYPVNDLLTDTDGTTFDPIFIESMAAGDLDRDGRPDLVVTTSSDIDYHTCETYLFRNVTFEEDGGLLYYDFRNVGRLDQVFNTDHFYARMPSLADIDGDSDLDLFMEHRYPDGDPANLLSYLRFYRNTGPTGLRYTRFRMTATAQKALTIPIITGPGGQVTVVAPTYNVVQNNSEGTLLPNAVWEAGPYVPTVDILDTTDLRSKYGTDSEMRSFVDVLPVVRSTESRAILVVGDTADDDLYTTFRDLAAYAYTVVRGEGLLQESVRMYAATNFDADGDGLNDVTGPPTLAALQDAVTGFGSDTDKLLVYLIDHGQRERFRLNATEFLEANTYDSWLDQIQAGGNGPRVTTVIDTCESGSFLDNIKGPRRINITGANVGPTAGVAMFDKTQYISFSLSFWGWLAYGNTYGSSFRYAKNAIQSLNPLQQPQADDNGNGTGNDADDGILADSERPGADFDVHGPSVFISDIAPSQAITSNTTTLWLSGVIAPFPVDNAKAIIVPPNFKRPALNNDDEQPVTNLPVVFLTYNSTLKRWEGNFSGFTEGGIYQVQYFISTGGQVFASPHIGFVDRINAPDAWESDNSPQASKWLPINTVAGHNFHTANDEDWIRFTVPAGTATLAIIGTRHNCQPVLELYRVSDLVDDPGAAPVRSATAEEPGEELTVEHTFPGGGQYLVRVRNLNGAISGEGTSYQALIAVDTGGVVPTSLIISAIDQNNASLAGVSVRLASDPLGTTDDEGIVQAVVSSYGSYTLSASKAGYKDTSLQVFVNNITESAVLHLEPEGTEPPPKEGGCAGCGPGYVSSGGAAGDAVFVIALVGVLLAVGRRRAAV